MAALEFPSAGLVANVTTYTANGVTYLWNGSSWVSRTGTGYVGSNGYTGSAGSGYTGSAGAGGSVATPTALGTVFGYTTGNNNTALGCNAGNITMTGADNIAIGGFSLSSNTTGVNNTAVGRGALGANSSGKFNVAVGHGSLGANTTGCQNTAIGNNALCTNCFGTCLTAVGHQALFSNTTGCNNVAVGQSAMFNNSTGTCNVAVGSSALSGNTIGFGNIGIGNLAGSSITTGVNNTVIGSLPAATGCVCTVLIGAGACERIKVDNTGLYINGTVFTGGGGGFTSTDDTTTNATYYPIVATTSGGSTAKTSSTKLQFNPSNGTFYATVFQSLSDADKKTDIALIADALSIVENIRGVKFNWKDTGLPSAGLIAQDVEQYLPEVIDNNNGIKSLNYNGVIGVLVEAVKELSARIQMLESK